MKIGFAIALMVILSTNSGCLSEDEGFEWPEPEKWDCSIEIQYNLSCEKYLDSFQTPILSLEHPLGEELWIVELSGKISSWDGLTISQVADISDMVSNCHYEQGLLGAAFDENFSSSRAILLSFVEEGSCEGPNEANLILASATISEEGKLDRSSIVELMAIEQPYRNHNGGHMLNIGNNQFLWGLGDGGSGSDPDGNGQDSSTPLGSILLFSFIDGEIAPVVQDPVGDPYVLHYGLRNPWRFDVDNQNRLWIADVGQNCWEEVNVVAINQTVNFGWSEREGMHKFLSNGYTNEDGTCDIDEDEEVSPQGFTDPIFSYPHKEGNCSITGGYWMDWGPLELRDTYLFGDFCTGSIWTISEIDGNWTHEYIGSSGGMIVGFGKGLEGELLIFHWTGEIVNLGL